MTDVAVAGGGVIGLAIAWRLGQRGLRVIVADPAPGSGASHAAAGMLAPVAEAQRGEPALLALGLESWRRYPAFVADLEAAAGRTVGLERSGSLLVARDADDLAVLEREQSFRGGEGLQVERLSSAECRRLEPGLSPSVRGGLLAPGDLQVDPRRLVRALLDACARCGVAMVRETAALWLDGERAAGLMAGGERIEAATVVLAAGASLSLLDGVPPYLGAAIRPVKGQVLRLRRTGRRRLDHLIRGQEVYIVERPDGEVVVGATAEERGFDTAVTAGAVYELLRAARELVPDVTELELQDITVGLRPGTADNAPLIGATDVAGLQCATGHFRNGILLAPVTADMVAGALCGENPGVDAAPFSPLRFHPTVVAA